MNSEECIMTRLQEMSLDYHFSVEQEVGSSTYSFFGFNGKSRYLLNYITLVNLLIQSYSVPYRDGRSLADSSNT